jgi:hypothetical protein
MHLGCYLIDDWQEAGIECRVVSRMQSPGTLNVDTDVCALLFIDTSQRRPIWARRCWGFTRRVDVHYADG